VEQAAEMDSSRGIMLVKLLVVIIASGRIKEKQLERRILLQILLLVGAMIEQDGDPFRLHPSNVSTVEMGMRIFFLSSASALYRIE
jgi:hypothetical protein